MYTVDFRKEVVSALKDMPINTVAKKFNINRSTIWRWKQAQKKPKKKRKDRKIDLTRLKEFTQTLDFLRYSYREIAEDFEVSVSSIHQRIKTLRASGYKVPYRRRDYVYQKNRPE